MRRTYSETAECVGRLDSRRRRRRKRGHWSLSCPYLRLAAGEPTFLSDRVLVLVLVLELRAQSLEAWRRGDEDERAEEHCMYDLCAMSTVACVRACPAVRLSIDFLLPTGDARGLYIQHSLATTALRQHLSSCQLTICADQAVRRDFLLGTLTYSVTHLSSRLAGTCGSSASAVYITSAGASSWRSDLWLVALALGRPLCTSVRPCDRAWSRCIKAFSR